MFYQRALGFGASAEDLNEGEVELPHVARFDEREGTKRKVLDRPVAESVVDTVSQPPSRHRYTSCVHCGCLLESCSGGLHLNCVRCANRTGKKLIKRLFAGGKQ